MNPEDLALLAKLLAQELSKKLNAETIATALLQQANLPEQSKNLTNTITHRLRGSIDTAVTGVVQEMNSNIDKKFDELEGPVNKAVITQYAIASSTGGIALLLLGLLIFMCCQRKELTYFFNTVTGRQAKLEEGQEKLEKEVESQREEIAHSLSPSGRKSEEQFFGTGSGRADHSGSMHSVGSTTIRLSVVESGALAPDQLALVKPRQTL